MTIRTELDSFLLNHDLILHENPEKKLIKNLIISSIELDLFITQIRAFIRKISEQCGYTIPDNLRLDFRLDYLKLLQNFDEIHLGLTDKLAELLFHQIYFFVASLPQFWHL